MAFGKNSLVRREDVTICGRHCTIKVYERKKGDEWKVTVTDNTRESEAARCKAEDFEEAFETAVSAAEGSILVNEKRLDRRRNVDRRMGELIENSDAIGDPPEQEDEDDGE